MGLSAAKEGSTYIVKVAFYDEAGSAMTPVSASWSLRDNTGAIVNNRSAVSMIVSSVVNVVLSDDDLIFEPNSSTMRTFTVEARYNGVYGSNLPLNDEVTFDITNLVGV